MKYDHILFPVDFSDHNRALARQVEWLANRFDSRVSLLHVSEVPKAIADAARQQQADLAIIGRGNFRQIARLLGHAYVRNHPEDTMPRTQLRLQFDRRRTGTFTRRTSTRNGSKCPCGCRKSRVRSL